VSASRTAKNAGTYVTSASGTDSNYNLSFVDGAMIIDKAALTVTALNSRKIYDANAFTGGAGVSYDGFVGNETAAALSGTLSYSGNSQGARNTGAYVLTPGGVTSNNYSLAFSNGALTVIPAQLLIRATTNTKTFDGKTDAQAVPAINGLVGSDTVIHLSESYADANPGNKKTLTVQSGYQILDGNSGSNYAVTLLPDTTGVILALPVAVLAPVISAPKNVIPVFPNLTVLPFNSPNGADSRSGAPPVLEASGSGSLVSGSTNTAPGQPVTSPVSVGEPLENLNNGKDPFIALPDAKTNGVQNSDLPAKDVLTND
jgi:hypothetical protein